jgi:hypothetical protein
MNHARLCVENERFFGRIGCDYTSTQQHLCEYQYWFPLNQSHLVPSKNAITLSPTEYSQLKDPTSIMDDFVPEIMLVVPYLSTLKFHKYLVSIA